MIDQGFDVEILINDLFFAFMFRRPSVSEVDSMVYRYGVERCLDGIVKDLITSHEHKRIRRNTAYPPGHFYSAIVDVNQAQDYLMRHNISISEDDAFYGINMSTERMDELWASLAEFFRLAPWEEEKKEDFRYYYNNQSYPFSDALVWFAFLQHFKPNKVIEIGSGFSSAVMLDTLDLSCNNFSTGPSLTFIQPYPHTIEKILFERDWSSFDLIESFVQDVPLDLFKTLDAGDVLFIDSTHVLKTGSDVAFEINEILPRLKPGVFVHFHDIFYPFEYPRGWVVNASRSWNEIYVLRAYLQNNPNYRVELFTNYQVRMRLLDSAFRAERFRRNPGGSLWLRKLS